MSHIFVCSSIRFPSSFVLVEKSQAFSLSQYPARAGSLVTTNPSNIRSLPFPSSAPTFCTSLKQKERKLST